MSNTDLIPVTVLVAASRVSALYAFLGGASVAALTASAAPTGNPNPAPSELTGAGTQVAQVSGQSAPSSGTEATATAAAGDPNEVDASGTPWSAEKHAATRGKTKDGLWRMKVGVSRPANEGLPAGSATGTAPSGSETAGATTAAPAAEDDEFAQWAAAAGTSAPAPRTWTDADLSKLCNQAAIAKNDPGPVKAIIAKYVPEGEVPHSRSIPADKREAFATDVETTLGIKYEG